MLFRNHTYHRPPIIGHRIESHGTQDPDLRRPKSRTGLEHNLTLANIFAQWHTIGSRGDRGQNTDHPIYPLGLFNHHYSIRPIWHRGTRHNLCCLTAHYGLLRHDACLNLLDHIQRHGVLCRRTRNIGADDRVAIHRCLLEGRHIDVRHHVLGQSVAEGIHQRN